MKILKYSTGILAAIGFLLIIGTVGADDFYTIELQQPHDFGFGQILVGLLMIIPCIIVNWIDSEYYFDGKDDDV